MLDGVSIKKTPSLAKVHAISSYTFRRWLNRLKGGALKINSFLSARLLELKPGLSPPKASLSNLAFLFDAGEALHYLTVHSVFSSEESLDSSGVFDVLNLILPNEILL